MPKQKLIFNLLYTYEKFLKKYLVAAKSFCGKWYTCEPFAISAH
jgi:hypothetical protein